MKQIVLFIGILLLACGCQLSPWQSPSGPEASGILLRVNPTVTFPPNMHMLSSRITLYKEGQQDPIFIFTDHEDLTKFPWDPMLIELPPGKYSFWGFWTMLTEYGYNPYYQNYIAPESTRVAQEIKPGMVLPLGEYSFDITVTDAGNQVNYNKKANGNATPKALRKLIEDARKHGKHSEMWKPFLDRGAEEIDRLHPVNP